jgi:trans-aconitate methyltransferase
MAADGPQLPDDPAIDPTVANPARVYDVLLGGASNFAADREAAARMLPTAAQTARLNRSFLRRAVRFLVEAGIDQFLDLGSGIPTVGNVHEIAQRHRPASRVVYVDNEQVAVHHARQLLATNTGAAMVGADLRRPELVLGNAEVTRLLDFDRPIAVLFLAVFHFVPDSDNPGLVIDRYLDHLAPGSYVALSHYTADSYDPEQRATAARAGATYQQGTRTPVVPRSRAEVAALLHRLDLVDPGLVPAPPWRPDDDPQTLQASTTDNYAAVGKLHT